VEVWDIASALQGSDDAQGLSPETPTSGRSHFVIPMQFVPDAGPQFTR